ncbi:hypothetical protein BSKO_12689 [Bryopsis sp. KO-2023]|nr:hypothetical protein BSKO_12689 [Bryopsis sp. KO-2023]
MDTAPSQTIYVSNLFEKINKEELKRCMHALFSQFGRILDVVCMRTPKLRGQAWIVFSDVSSATNAMSTLQAFPFFDKPINIKYAKGKSDAVAKRDGTFSYKKEDRKKRKDAPGAANAPESGKKPAPSAANRPQGGSSDQPIPLLESGGGGGGDANVEGKNPPNKILFVENLPEDTNEMMLGILMKNFDGFKEVRMVESRPGIAFVEFEHAEQGGVAIKGLQGHKINPQHSIKISYAKQ